MGRTPAPTERIGGFEQPAGPRRRGRPPTRVDQTPTLVLGSDTFEMLPFGAVLKLLRERRGLSQGALAERIGKSTSLVSLFESEQRRPTNDTVSELVSALRLSAEEERQFVQAAGFAEGDVSGAVRRIVDVLGQHLDLGDAERTALLSDLDAQVNGWQGVFRAAKRFSAGEFDSAREDLVHLAKHGEYSPTLTTYVQLQLADAQSQFGQLAAASSLLRTARERMDRTATTPGWLPWQEAEVRSMQALVAKREGDHELAVTLLQQCILVYERLLTESAEHERIAFAGLGLTYKQLAEVTLLQGDPTLALRYCANAEAHLSMARRTAATQQWVRRTLGLKAWACSQLRDFDRAEALRQQVQGLCDEAGDRFGQNKNLLYRGDDYRRRIKLALIASEAGVPENDVKVDNHWDGTSDLNATNATVLERDPATRRAHLREVLRRDDVSGWVETAESCYMEALSGLKETGERLLLGRCYRGLGIVVRYKALRNGTEHDFDVARLHLDRALSIENANGQRRRLPSVYESIAELEWDRGDLHSAVAYYEAALELLERALSASPDAASADQRARVHAALEVLSPTKRIVIPRSRRFEGHVSPVLSSPRWRELSAALLRTVREFVALTDTPPTSFYAESPEWEEQTLELDVAPGPRILAQNWLSSSLSSRIPPGGLVPEAAARHIGRFHSFASSVQSAKDTRGGDRSRDLCCRPEIESALGDPEQQPLMAEQVRNAYDYMTKHRLGYRLDSSLYRLPLGFAVKGTRTLIEIPARLANAFPLGRRQTGIDPNPRRLCYAFDNPELAERLRELFDQLVDAGNADTTSDTCTWLKELMERPPRVRRESMAM